MSSSDLAVALPFGAAILLVGGAVAGSRLSAVLKRRIELYLLLPVLCALGIGAAGWAIWRHDWLILVGIALLLAPMAVRIIRRRQQSLQAERQPPPVAS